MRTIQVGLGFCAPTQTPILFEVVHDDLMLRSSLRVLEHIGHQDPPVQTLNLKEVAVAEPMLSFSQNPSRRLSPSFPFYVSHQIQHEQKVFSHVLLQK
jgi:hypothetical protein